MLFNQQEFGFQDFRMISFSNFTRFKMETGGNLEWNSYGLETYTKKTCILRVISRREEISGVWQVRIPQMCLATSGKWEVTNK